MIVNTTGEVVKSGFSFIKSTSVDAKGTLIGEVIDSEQEELNATYQIRYSRKYDACYKSGI